MSTTTIVFRPVSIDTAMSTWYREHLGAPELEVRCEHGCTIVTCSCCGQASQLMHAVDCSHVVAALAALTGPVVLILEGDRYALGEILDDDAEAAR